jgi:hypothetical protein
VTSVDRCILVKIFNENFIIWDLMGVLCFLFFGLDLKYSFVEILYRSCCARIIVDHRMICFCL